MAVGERDPHTGHMTTGHEWNDIKELNTPVPRTVYVFLGPSRQKAEAPVRGRNAPPPRSSRA